MKHFTKRLLSATLVLAMAIALTAGLPLTAGASGSKAVSMELANSHSDNTTQKGVNKILTAASPGDVITVTGSKTNATSMLVLNIPAGVKVLWKAKYEDGPGFPQQAVPVIDLSGAGEFEVATGGSVKSNKTGSAIQVTGANTITVSGGEVEGGLYTIAMIGEGSTLNVSGGSVASYKDAGFVVRTDSSCTINISGGEVSSESSTAINAYSSTINVSGGEVSCGGVDSSAIFVHGSSTVNISNGTVGSPMFGYPVRAVSSIVNISGGVVSANLGYAISATYSSTVNISGGAVSSWSHAVHIESGTKLTISDGTVSSSHCAVMAKGADANVTINGGFVFGDGRTISGTDGHPVILHSDGAPAPVISAPGIVCGWDMPDEDVSYDEGSATDLIVSTGATAGWAIHPVTGDFGVAYKHSADDYGGFFTVEGVTVIAGEFVAPTITGPTSMTLAEGYEAYSTDAFAVGGTPEPVVTAQSDSPDITWNGSSKKLDIAAGIVPGTYRVILKAENGADPAATLTFTLTVKAEDDPDGGEPKPFPFTD
ncbi:MAG: hypothetical protein FWG48_01720, partial [Oscillospiraceae bacterium]|nr:hypothetical protein [Oscillospiraceae bacterium]